LGDLQLAPLPNCDSNDGDESNDVELFIPITAILFQPHTGKTHQLRVAAKSAGIPILEDVCYGGGTVTQRVENANFERTYLHASAIHFQLNDEDVTISSPPPFDHFLLPRQSTMDNGESNVRSSLQEVFETLMEKHCGCPQILDSIHGIERK
jgi:hypothetical protein